MAKLYPPYIEGTIPAFYTETEGTVQRTILTVPFSMNRSVGKASINGFSLKMKTINSNTFVYTNLTTYGSNDYEMENGEYFVEFDLGAASKLKVGNFYKIQLAYIDKSNEVGYYSTVGVVKYTTKPDMSIASLSRRTNVAQRTYRGEYSQFTTDPSNPKDPTEKEYSFQFVITDSEDNIIQDSGPIIHNSENDIDTCISTDEYTFSETLEKNIVYYVQYFVTTINKMTVKSIKYPIVNKMTLEPELKANLEAKLNYDNGYIEVGLKGKMTAEGDEASATGAFVITRSCSDTNFTEWHEVMKFQLHGQLPSRKLLIDQTIEQGKEYQYALQQYSDAGLYSEKMVSNVIMSDFEDAFLYDGKRQLKIKYNPKVSSFKIDKPESKIDTIGSKYPFFFRNGNVEYREFPIGGMISYLADNEQLFLTDEELNLVSNDDLKRMGTFSSSDAIDLEQMLFNNSGDYFDQSYFQEMKDNRERTIESVETAHLRTTNFLDYSIAAERKFKMTVLEWLTNGEPKLFRSPGEGNYVVRLMNVSLSPEDKTGRVIHSFTATAYEVAPCSYTAMVDYDIIDTVEENIIQLRWETVPLSTSVNKDDDIRYTKINNIYYAQGALLTSHRSARTVTFSDMQPGDIVYVLTTGNFVGNVTFNRTTKKYELKNEETCPGKIVIGATGTYTLDLDVNILFIGVPRDAQYNGLVTYSYYNDAQNVFNAIIDITPVDYLGQQFIGAHRNILEQILNIKQLDCTFLYLHFAKRAIGTAFYNNHTWYRDNAFTLEITDDPPNYFVDGNDFMQDVGYYADPLMLYAYEVDSFQAFINGIDQPITIRGIKRVTNDEVQRNLIGVINDQGQTVLQVYSGYYYVNDNGELINAGGTPYNPLRKYYIKDPLVFYYDPFRIAYPDDDPQWRREQNQVLVISPASYNTAVAYIHEIFPDIVDIVIDGLEKQSNVLTINNYQMDLTDTEKYNIDFRYDFSNIELSNGVVLECGYEVQMVTYTVETLGQVTDTAAYRNYHNVYNPISPEGYEDFLISRNNSMQFSNITGEQDYTSDLAYLNDLRRARSYYKAVYDAYIDLVTRQEAIWEEAHAYDQESIT